MKENRKDMLDILNACLEGAEGLLKALPAGQEVKEIEVSWESVDYSIPGDSEIDVFELKDALPTVKIKLATGKIIPFRKRG